MSSNSSPALNEPRSGGVDVNSDKVDIGGDVVGRDKVLNAGRDLIIAQPGSVVNVTTGEPARAVQPPAADAAVSRAANGVNPFGYKGKITDPALYLVRQPLTRLVFDELRKGGCLGSSNLRRATTSPCRSCASG